MPFNYFSAMRSVGGAVGRAFMGSATGRYGRSAQGMTLGMTAGAGYGLMSDRRSMLGGAITGVIMGGGIGLGVAAGRGMMRGYTRNMSLGMGMAAGVRDARRAQIAGIRASRFIGNTTSAAFNGFRSMWR